MSETSHTLAPWRACRIENETCIIDGSEQLIIDCDRRYSSVPEPEHAANIAMIVRAVNAHDVLVAALERMVELHDNGTRSERAADTARAAIRAAKGEE